MIDIIVASVSAIYGLGDPDSYMKMMLLLKVGDTVDQRDILRRLAELQYTRNDLDFSRGTYRVRGEVIDIFPAESDDIGVRVEMFDDEIENAKRIVRKRQNFHGFTNISSQCPGTRNKMLNFQK